MKSFREQYFETISSKEKRMSNLYWIKTKGQKILKYKRNWAQKELAAIQHPKKIILKARQLGISTDIQIDILDDALTIPNLSAGIICQTRDDATHIFENKLKFAYENLDPITRKAVEVETDNVNELKFSNGSIIRVGTSLRSSTLQRLHISEFGKIAKEYPHKAREIISGALNTVDTLEGGKIWIESTAEGREGHFYEMVKTAEALQLSGQELTPLDWQLIFFPWWRHPLYEMNIPYQIPSDLKEYFEDLNSKHGIALKEPQKWWYAAKLKEQKKDMKREFPSVPEEAFESTSEGLYYAKWIGQLRQKGQIGKFPPDPRLPVETVWDLGWSDATAIWGFQRQGSMARVVFYFHNSGEALPFYVNKLKEKEQQMGFSYGKHWLPHDVEVHDLSTGISRKQTLQQLGLKVEVLPPYPNSEAISAVRNFLPSCYFDEEECSIGITALEKHRKKWDDKQGCYVDQEHKDWNTIHGSHAFKYLTLAMEKGSSYDESDLNVIRHLNRRKRV